VSDAETFLDLLRARRSIRRFKPEPVPRALLEHLVEAAEWAPSAGNRQDWFFSVVTSRARIREMAEAVRSRWEAIAAAREGSGPAREMANYAIKYSDFADAPALIGVACRAVAEFHRNLLGADAEAITGSPFSAAAAAQNLMLAAHALGLGTCCMTAPLGAREELTKLFEIPRRHALVCLITVGFPEGPAPVPARRPVPEIARFIE
jgi:nitroreductase